MVEKDQALDIRLEGDVDADQGRAVSPPFFFHGSSRLNWASRRGPRRRRRRRHRNP